MKWAPLLAGALVACSSSGPDAPLSTEVLEGVASLTGATPLSKEARARAVDTCRAGLVGLIEKSAGPVKLEVFASKSVPEVEAEVGAWAPPLEALDEAAGDRLEVRIVDVSDDPAPAVEAELQEVVFTSRKKGYLGVVASAGGERETVPLISTKAAVPIELRLVKWLRRLAPPSTPHRIGVVRAGGLFEAMPLDTIARVEPTIELVDVELDAPLDLSLEGLILLQPHEDIPEAARRHIDGLLMRGGALVVLAGAAELDQRDDKTHAELDLHELDALLSGYGVNLQDTVVHDPEQAVAFPVQAGPGEAPKDYVVPGLLTLEARPLAAGGVSPAFLGTVGITTLPLPFPSPLSPRPDAQPDARLRVFATTSPASYQLREPFDAALRAEEPHPGEGAQPVGIAVEGTIRSAFDDRVAARGARIVVLASGASVSNPFAVTGEQPDDAAYARLAHTWARQFAPSFVLTLRGLLDWMTVEPRLLACSDVETESS